MHMLRRCVRECAGLLAPVYVHAHARMCTCRRVRLNPATRACMRAYRGMYTPYCVRCMLLTARAWVHARMRIYANADMRLGEQAWTRKRVGIGSA